MKDNSRKCAKCNASTAEKPNLVLHRFPKPGADNLQRMVAWAEFCYPDENCSSIEFLKKLYTNHKMLCNKHFPQSAFVENHLHQMKLHRYVIPSEHSTATQAEVSSGTNSAGTNQTASSTFSCMPLRWGIVTAAKICHDFVNAFNSYPGKDKEDIVIAAVAARDKTKAAAFAKVHNIPQVFDSYQALAASDAIDVAYIGALNPDHYYLAKLFLDNGKHVLCEKPLCMNFKQAQSLINLARAKKRFLMEAVWSRFSPSYKALEKQIEAGKLGEIQFVEVNFGVPIGKVDRVTQKALGGSALLDLGIYSLQFAQFVYKEEPKKVTAIGELNEDGVDVVNTVVLEYEGGRRAVLNIHANLKLWNKATVVGTKGRATLEDPFHIPTDLIHVDGTKESFPLHSSKIPYNFQNSAGLVYEALEVSRCIKEGLLESPRVTHKDSLNLAKLEDTIRQQIGVLFDVDDQEFP